MSFVKSLKKFLYNGSSSNYSSSGSSTSDGELTSDEKDEQKENASDCED